jgi:hypothetical protein
MGKLVHHNTGFNQPPQLDLCVEPNLSSMIDPHPSDQKFHAIHLHLPKYPLQQMSRKNIYPRTLLTPSHIIPSPRIPPPTRISHNLFIQIAISLCNRSAPAIRNNTSPRPLPTSLHPQILRLEHPFLVLRARCVPHAQRVVELETHFGSVLLGVEGEVFLEGCVEEEGGPFYHGGPSYRRCSGVGFEE